ncbi:hypothetical protein [Ottowia sp. SB7-C50]|uniref:hypothetical protein n=1 Tax=Ottowia sp. SB7-C50 TaxID=3081231 RepID=UPI00295599EA|nr:hypothetical protein [Ottowia sp. SB7-C50]WOP14325.1 hypothetical protein R0D99_10575 [Ottowia sp. SB7-C50]
MLSKSELDTTLDYYEQVFRSAKNNKETLLASKCSILEVCGWTEEAMDHLVRECSVRCGLSVARSSWLESKYIKTTHGFHYQTHFEKLVVAVVGYRILEAVETSIGTTFSSLTSALNELNPLRNHYAHTHFNSTSPYPKAVTAIPSPNRLKSLSNDIFSGLEAIEVALQSHSC